MSLLAMKAQLRATARSTGLSIVGAVFFGIGAAFLTVAAWIALSSAHGALVAALVVGGVYVGLGCIFFALASRRPVTPPIADPAYHARPLPVGAAIGPALVEALFVGISAGIANRSRTRR